MKFLLKNSKGFIKIPLLISIIAGIILISGVGYVGSKQYKNYQQELAETQRKASEEEKLKIEKLTEEIESLKGRPPQIIVKENTKEVSKEITASEINAYLTGVVKVSCDAGGSGSLWNLGDKGYVLLTNQHVIDGEANYCSVETNNLEGKSGGWGIYSVLVSNAWKWNTQTDVAVLKLSDIVVEGQENSWKSVNQLNYKISNLRKCPNTIPVGSSVVVIGYPAFAAKQIEYRGFLTTIFSRTITNGIISAYDTSETGYFGDLPYSNYYVSAKIDSGNSGGIAIAKDDNGLCVLGIPTWLSMGNYETQGIIQNINNVMYVK